MLVERKYGSLRISIRLIVYEKIATFNFHGPNCTIAIPIFGSCQLQYCDCHSSISIFQLMKSHVFNPQNRYGTKKCLNLCCFFQSLSCKLTRRPQKKKNTKHVLCDKDETSLVRIACGPERQSICE